MTHGSLFAGYGGLDLAIEQVFGATTAWVSDVDPGANLILAHRYPHAPNLGDITRVDWSQVEPVDIISGGFPCQDISAAGRMAGLAEGTRSGLFWEVVRCVAATQPKYVVLENVSNLLSGKDGVNDPNDACICGWARGWGGLHSDPAHEADILPPRNHRDDIEGPPAAQSDAGVVGRQGEDCPQSDREVGRGARLDRGRGGGNGVLAGHSAISGVEGGAGPHCTVDCADSERVAAAVGAPTGRPAVMDGRGAPEVRDAQGVHAPTEREGAAPIGDATPGREVSCPACGRPVVDGPGRNVQRSWMGTVLGALAGLGFRAQWHCLRASDIGACHGRLRVFILATRCDLPAYPHDAGLQGQQGQAGAASSERHGYPVAGVGRSDLTFLPTPRVSDTSGAGAHGSGGTDLRTTVALLPTPHAGMAGRGASDPAHRKSLNPAHSPQLDELGTNAGLFGRYASAITRHERTLGRPAPEPTEPGTKGNPRLSAKFVEFMMCLPDGWVTDVPGITRNQALKALGNGVVPIQAAAALTTMLAREAAA